MTSTRHNTKTYAAGSKRSSVRKKWYALRDDFGLLGLDRRRDLRRIVGGAGLISTTWSSGGAPSPKTLVHTMTTITSTFYVELYFCDRLIRKRARVKILVFYRSKRKKMCRSAKMQFFKTITIKNYVLYRPYYNMLKIRILYHV